jgi:hypothetical protein
MDEYGIAHHAHHVSVDCRRADALVWSDRSRALAVACIERTVDRVLVDATGCNPEGHVALSDALTALMLAGMPLGFRVALVIDARLFEAFADLQRDVQWLNLPTRLFTETGAALEWLLSPMPARYTACSTSS